MMSMTDQIGGMSMGMVLGSVVLIAVVALVGAAAVKYLFFNSGNGK